MHAQIRIPVDGNFEIYDLIDYPKPGVGNIGYIKNGVATFWILESPPATTPFPYRESVASSQYSDATRNYLVEQQDRAIEQWHKDNPAYVDWQTRQPEISYEGLTQWPIWKMGEKSSWQTGLFNDGT